MGYGAFGIAASINRSIHCGFSGGACSGLYAVSVIFTTFVHNFVHKKFTNIKIDRKDRIIGNYRLCQDQCPNLGRNHVQLKRTKAKRLVS